MILNDKIDWLKNDEQLVKWQSSLPCFFLFMGAELDLWELLFIWFLLILIQAHWVAAALIIYWKAQSWLLPWSYMLNFKGLLFQYGKRFIVLATLHHEPNVKKLESNQRLQKYMHGFAYIFLLTFLNITTKVIDTCKESSPF